MNPNPPFRARGFGPNLIAYHDHAVNTPLQWATFALVLLVALTLGALVVARMSRGGGRLRMRGRRRPDPLDVVRMRFASGQIGRDEYLQTVGDLTPDAPTQPQPPD